MALKMALSVPLPDILAYRKVSKAYFGLVDVLCHNHAAVVAQRDTTTFAFLVSSLDAGESRVYCPANRACATS